MQSRNTSLTFTQILGASGEGVENVLPVFSNPFPGNPNRIGGTYEELASSTQRLYFVNSQILEPSSTESLLQVRLVTNDNEDVSLILNAVRPKIPDLDSLHAQLRLVNNEKNIESALEYDQNLRTIVDSAILRIRNDAVIISQDNSGYYSFIDGLVPGRREEIALAINNAQNSALNTYRSLEILIPEIENWRTAFHISSNIFNGIPRRFFDVLLFFGEEFCNKILFLISHHIGGVLSETFLYQHLGNIIAPFFALFLGYPLISSLTVQEWINLLRSGLVHTQLIFNVLNTRTTESLNSQEVISTVLADYNRNSHTLNSQRISVRGFSWSRIFWDLNLSWVTNILRLSRNLSVFVGSLITVGYSGFYGFPLVRQLLIERDVLIRHQSELLTTINPQILPSALNNEVVSVLQNFFYEFATQFPSYFQF
jgi:hypothetical protein